MTLVDYEFDEVTYIDVVPTNPFDKLFSETSSLFSASFVFSGDLDRFSIVSHAAVAVNVHNESFENANNYAASSFDISAKPL